MYALILQIHWQVGKSTVKVCPIYTSVNIILTECFYWHAYIMYKRDPYLCVKRDTTDIFIYNDFFKESSVQKRKSAPVDGGRGAAVPVGGRGGVDDDGEGRWKTI